MDDSFLTVPGRRSVYLTIKEKSRKVLKKRLPILQWLPSYTAQDVLGDFLAGTSVALTAVPQTMAYAILAGLSPEYGLYSSFVGAFVYIFLGSCRQVTIGPTAIICLVALKTCGEDFPQCVVLASFYSGIIELLFFTFRLGSCIALISDPVTIGFTSGAALTIASSQLKSLFGLTSATGNDFVGYWTDIFRNISATSFSVPDTVLGVSCIIILLLLQKLGLILKSCIAADGEELLKKIIWVLTVSRNVVVVVSTTILAYAWGTPPFKMTGTVRAGLPAIHPPHFLLPNRRNDTSYGDTLTFGETIGFLGTGPLVIAVIAILQNVGISKAYGSGQRIDGNQEILSLGVTKIIGGFFSSLPTSGSFSRSAVNEASGVKSQFGGFFTGVFIIVSLLILTPTFQYIPKASLAAVIVCAVLVMIDYEVLVPMWKVSRIDVLICALTFFSSLLLGMEYGIGVGVGSSIAKILYEFVSTTFSPEFRIDEETRLNYILLQPLEGFRFPSVDAIRKCVNKYFLEYTESHRVVVLDCLNWASRDYTVAAALASLLKSVKRNGKYLILINVNPKCNTALLNAGLSNTDLLTLVCELESDLGGLLKDIPAEPFPAAY